VFRPLRHKTHDGRQYLLNGPYAQALGVNGQVVVFAPCGAACWLQLDAKADLPECPNCKKRTGNES
jgi:hypothetical protein